MNQLLVVLILLASLTSTAAQTAESPHLRNAVSLFKQEQYEEALAEFTEAHIAQPEDASIDNLIGVTETKLGRLDEANRYYDLASRLDPHLLGPHKNLAVNYLDTKNYDLAEKE